MRKIKVVILLAVVILSLILLNANAEDVNEGENFCSEYNYPIIIINITAKRVCDGEATKQKFPTFEQGEILFVTSLEMINNNDCIISPFNISFPIDILQTGKSTGLGWYKIPTPLMPRKKNRVIFEENCSGSVGSGLQLNELGTWKMGLAVIQYNEFRKSTTMFQIEGYNLSSWEYTFEVESKTTIENLDLIKALTNSSIESAKSAKEANELSKSIFLLSVIATFIAIVSLYLTSKSLKQQGGIGIKQTKILEEIQDTLKLSGDKQEKVFKEQSQLLDEIKNLQESQTTTYTKQSERECRTLNRLEKIGEKQTEILTDIRNSKKSKISKE